MIGWSVTGGLDRPARVRPQRPLVEAWFSSPEGYYSLADSPANATCQVRCGAAAALSLCSGPEA